MRLLTVFLSLVIFSCNSNNESEYDPSIETPHIGIDKPANIYYNIINMFPHDTSAYTQGLEFHHGILYESTGDYETSSLRKTNFKTGAVLQKHVMGSAKIFGEGITHFNNKIYQLTWQNHDVYVYDANNINKVIKTFQWPYEGWGITHDSSSLIISDGSSNIYFVDADNFRVKNTLSIRNNEGPVDMINELEYVNGFIYANVYQTNSIIKINAENGHIVGIIQLAGLLQPNDVVPNRTDVLNGIAFNASSNSFFITGKRWPKMFELKLN
jgi:glutamine cyclotransferase